MRLIRWILGWVDGYLSPSMIAAPFTRYRARTLVSAATVTAIVGLAVLAADVAVMAHYPIDRLVATGLLFLMLATPLVLKKSADIRLAGWIYAAAYLALATIITILASPNSLPTVPFLFIAPIFAAYLVHVGAGIGLRFVRHILCRTAVAGRRVWGAGNICWRHGGPGIGCDFCGRFVTTNRAPLA